MQCISKGNWRIFRRMMIKQVITRRHAPALTTAGPPLSPKNTGSIDATRSLRRQYLARRCISDDADAWKAKYYFDTSSNRRCHGRRSITILLSIVMRRARRLTTMIRDDEGGGHQGEGARACASSSHYRISTLARSHLHGAGNLAQATITLSMHRKPRFAMHV